MSLRDRFDRALASLRLPPGCAVVAVSGGPDSVALLDLLIHSPRATQFSLQVAHLDHGIHPESAQVSESVRSLAASYQLPFVGHRLELGPAATETAARDARYQWLESVADRVGAEVIFTAHHRDDQVETLLMRILHGTGPAGLAGMSARRGRLVRPLLRFSHEELSIHARSLGTPGWDDPANRDRRHLRSWVRMELLPVLRERIPEVDDRLLRVARLAARNRAAWDLLLEEEPELDLRVECDGVSVAASPLRDYDSVVAEAVLSALGRRAGCHVGPVRAARIERLLAGGRSGAVAQLGQGCAAELSFDRLHLFREPRSPASGQAPEEREGKPVAIEGDSGSARLGSWVIGWNTGPAPDNLERETMASWFSPGDYLVRPWRPGDRIRPLGGCGRRLVVRCMQDARIARHQRAAWPVVLAGQTVVWVPGACRSADAVPPPGSSALRIDAHLG